MHPGAWLAPQASPVCREDRCNPCQSECCEASCSGLSTPCMWAYKAPTSSLPSPPAGTSRPQNWHASASCAACIAVRLHASMKACQSPPTHAITSNRQRTILGMSKDMKTRHRSVSQARRNQHATLNKGFADVTPASAQPAGHQRIRSCTIYDASVAKKIWPKTAHKGQDSACAGNKKHAPVGLKSTRIHTAWSDRTDASDYACTQPCKAASRLHAINSTKLGPASCFTQQHDDRHKSGIAACKSTQTPGHSQG
jgi:hypothetical protein